MSTIAIKQISKDSSKRISKKDRKEQRAEFRVIEDFVVSCAYYERVCLFDPLCELVLSSVVTRFVSRLLMAAYFSQVNLIIKLFLVSKQLKGEAPEESMRMQGAVLELNSFKELHIVETLRTVLGTGFHSALRLYPVVK